MAESMFEKLGKTLTEGLEKIQETYDALTSDLGTNRKKQAILVGIGIAIVLYAFLVLNHATVPLTLHVTDSKGQPLDEATVRLFDSAGNFVSSGKTANGKVTFMVPPGKIFTYTVSMDGYQKANGQIDPNHPESMTILLVSNKTPAPINPIQTVQASPLPLPAIQVVLPRSDSNDIPFANVQTADAQLNVTIRDSTTRMPIADASVSLYDGATQAFLVQSNTDSQGVLSAGVRQNTKVTIKAAADKYAPSEPLTVSIDGPTATADITLDSESSRNAIATKVTVTYANGTAATGALVQIFSNLPVVEQIVPDKGVVAALLSKEYTYTARASQTGYVDAISTLTAGDSITEVLSPNPVGLAPAQLTVTLNEFNGQASPGGLIGIYKKINTAWVPYASSTANSLGVSIFTSLQSSWDVQVNATSVYGTGSATGELNLTNGTNRITLTFAQPYPTPTLASNPSVKPIGTPTEAPSATASASATARATQSPSPETTTTTQVKLCLNNDDGPNYATINNYRYTLMALNNGRAAAFQVYQNNGVFCPMYSPDCLYAMGSTSDSNAALALNTHIDAQLVSVDSQKSCVGMTFSIPCSGNSCIKNICPSTSNPVCGSNGISYLNACFATSDKVNAYASGTCSLQCTNQYDPVCTTGGIQYDNACDARQDHQTYQSGICTYPTNGLYIDLPAYWSAVAPINAGSLVTSTCTTNHRYLFQSYDPSAKTYLPVLPTIGGITDMQYATGYLVYSDTPCRLYWDNQNAALPYQKTLMNGWNLIGAPQSPLAISDVSGNCGDVQILNRWGVADQAQTDSTPLGRSDVLQPGHGYLAYSNFACTLRQVCHVTYMCKHYYRWNGPPSNTCEDHPEFTTESSCAMTYTQVFPCKDGDATASVTYNPTGCNWWPPISTPTPAPLVERCPDGTICPNGQTCLVRECSACNPICINGVCKKCTSSCQYTCAISGQTIS